MEDHYQAHHKVWALNGPASLNNFIVSLILFNHTCFLLCTLLPISPSPFTTFLPCIHPTQWSPYSTIWASTVSVFSLSLPPCIVSLHKKKMFFIPYNAVYLLLLSPFWLLLSLAVSLPLVSSSRSVFPCYYLLSRKSVVSPRLLFRPLARISQFFTFFESFNPFPVPTVISFTLSRFLLPFHPHPPFPRKILSLYGKKKRTHSSPTSPTKITSPRILNGNVCEKLE